MQIQEQQLGKSVTYLFNIVFEKFPLLGKYFLLGIHMDFSLALLTKSSAQACQTESYGEIMWILAPQLMMMMMILWCDSFFPLESTPITFCARLRNSFLQRWELLLPSAPRHIIAPIRLAQLCSLYSELTRTGIKVSNPEP